MRFLLDYRINSIFITKILFRIYTILVRNVYILEYKKENNHYIPQFLLRQFRIPNTGNIYEYKISGLAKPISIGKEAALIPDLYTTIDKATKQKSSFIEKQLFAFTLEKYASRVISQLQKSPELDLTNIERSIITSFVAFQYTRTPCYFALIKLVIEYLHLGRKIPLDEIANLDFCKNALFANKYQISHKDLFSFGEKNNLKLTGAENLILKIAIEAGNILSQRIYKKSIGLVGVNTPGFFYLPDNPVGMIDTNNGEFIGTLFNEINENTLICLPISPTQCLYYLESTSKIDPRVIGMIISHCLKRNIFKFAYSDRDTKNIKGLF